MGKVKLEVIVDVDNLNEFVNLVNSEQAYRIFSEEVADTTAISYDYESVRSVAVTKCL